MSPRLCFILCQIAGFSLLFALWILNGEIAGFFLLLLLVIMSLLRFRVSGTKYTVLLDLAACVAMVTLWEYAPYALAVPLFSAMYLGIYPAAIAVIYLFFNFEPLLAVTLAFGTLCGLFLGFWERERNDKLTLRDTAAGRYYELESLQSDLTAALAQVERMTAVAERTRIARDIHDNAGHEIVAAYISLQTARTMLDNQSTDGLELYDAALERLNTGANKIREAVHNLSAVTFLGVDNLRDTCRRFPACKVDFNVYGDTTRVPIYVWTVLEACLNEGLTNAARHASATLVSVDLDVTPHIVRLCIENDGVTKTNGKSGNGIRNLRHRAAAIGGSLSVDAGEVFRVICVIPIKEDVL
ncbi:MAG: histidine kinase [Oscillospiraceae bacterium]|nr:histidine kinase [Oscillospiraceae bacterium]